MPNPEVAVTLTALPVAIKTEEPRGSLFFHVNRHEESYSTNAESSSSEDDATPVQRIRKEGSLHEDVPEKEIVRDTSFVEEEKQNDDELPEEQYAEQIAATIREEYPLQTSEDSTASLFATLPFAEIRPKLTNCPGGHGLNEFTTSHNVSLVLC